jgi:hypothetical protein
MPLRPSGAVRRRVRRVHLRERRGVYLGGRGVRLRGTVGSEAAGANLELPDLKTLRGDVGSIASGLEGT